MIMIDPLYADRRDRDYLLTLDKKKLELIAALEEVDRIRERLLIQIAKRMEQREQN